jgi:hypothetical protein
MIHSVILAQAGIQLIIKTPRSGTTSSLSASRNVYFCWIPACAGMTVVIK